MAKRPSPESLLIPSFDDAFWRNEEFRRFRDFPAFDKKKGHREPDELQPSAERWAAELAREESAEEIRRAYENAVVILRNRRSQMERTETTLVCPQFRYEIFAGQDQDDPSRVRVARELRIETPLNELPPEFDDMFAFRPDELVVPVTGALERRAVLLTLEDWEHALRARLSESADQAEYRLRLPTGFVLRVDLRRRETVFSQDNVSGVLTLAQSVARELQAFGSRLRLL